jgi:hypothetical protein
MSISIYKWWTLSFFFSSFFCCLTIYLNITN